MASLIRLAKETSLVYFAGLVSFAELSHFHLAISTISSHLSGRILILPIAQQHLGDDCVGRRYKDRAAVCMMTKQVLYAQH
jgi:hypothetical protein